MRQGNTLMIDRSKNITTNPFKKEKKRYIPVPYILK